MKKFLGQHFLINQAAIKKIVAALNLKSGDTVIEIGPGRGALTFPILEECRKLNCKIIGIEKDKELVNKLLSHSVIGLKVMVGDALKILPDLMTQLPNNSVTKIVGNIPYYITGKLLRTLGDLITNNQLLITKIILMLQKEVAERICAQPPRMNLLAAAVQFWAEPKILFSLKPSDFSPPPEVHSAVIKLETRKQNLESRIMENYYKLIKIVFKQPRKTLVNNLGIGLKRPKNEIENTLKKVGIDPLCRPQNLSIKDLHLLTTLFLG